MITYAYKPISLDILVYKENEYIGDIVKKPEGYAFHHKDALENGYVFPTLKQCKLSLEIDSSTEELVKEITMSKDVKGLDILRETPSLAIKVKYGTIGVTVKDSILEFKYVGTKSDVKRMLDALMKELEKHTQI